MYACDKIPNGDKRRENATLCVSPISPRYGTPFDNQASQHHGENTHAHTRTHAQRESTIHACMYGCSFFQIFEPTESCVKYASQ